METPNFKTAEQIVDTCNKLARTFYYMQGCEVDADFKFYEARHPAEIGCWNMAVTAYYHIEGTDVEDCINELNSNRPKKE